MEHERERKRRERVNGTEYELTEMRDEESDSGCSRAFAKRNLTEEGEEMPRWDRVGREEMLRATNEEGEKFQERKGRSNRRHERDKANVGRG